MSATRRFNLADNRPAHLALDTPWGKPGIEAIITRAEAEELIAVADAAINMGRVPADWLSATHLGTCLHIVGRSLDGMYWAQRAVEMKRCAVTLLNLAVIVETFGHFDEALKLAKEANEDDETNQFAGLQYAQGLLREGRWEQAWPLFEWYSWGHLWQGELAEYIPPWRGEHLQGKRVLVIQGGGYGDNMMFFRWVGNLKRMGAHVTYACPVGLAPLLEGHPFVDALIEVREGPETGDLPEFLPVPGRLAHDNFPEETVAQIKEAYNNGIPIKEICETFECLWEPAYDYFIPIMGLARMFNATPRNCGISKPYLGPPLKSKPINGRRQRVGICWSGAEKLDPRRHRSLNQDQVSRILAVNTVDWVNLQFGVPAPVGIIDPGIKNWMDTANTIAELDFVITVDTGVMHLAGAMNIPTWVMLPSLSDWKFLRDKPTMPFYPSLKLFRNGEGREGLDHAVDQVLDALCYF